MSTSMWRFRTKKSREIKQKTSKSGSYKIILPTLHSMVVTTYEVGKLLCCLTLFLFCHLTITLLMPIANRLYSTKKISHVKLCAKKRRMTQFVHIVYQHVSPSLHVLDVVFLARNIIILQHNSSIKAHQDTKISFWDIIWDMWGSGDLKVKEATLCHASSIVGHNTINLGLENEINVGPNLITTTEAPLRKPLNANCSRADQTVIILGSFQVWMCVRECDQAVKMSDTLKYVYGLHLK